VRGALKVDEAADYLSVSRATLYRLMASGDLAFVQIHRGHGGRRLAVKALDEYLERNTIGVAS